MGDPNDPTQNITIWDDTKTKNVTVTTDGSKERLDVNSGSFQEAAFTPKVDFDSTGTTLNTSTFSTILSVTAAGKLDSISLGGSSSNYQVRLTVDSVEVYDLSMSDISSIGLSNAVDAPIRTETADKNFRHRPNEAMDFETSFLVEAKATSSTPTVTHLITYRESA